MATAAAVPEDPNPTYTERVLRLIRAGDLEAREVLVRYLQPFLMKQAHLHQRRCRVRGCQDPADTVNEVLFRFFQPGTIKRFVPQGAHALRRFLLGILRNVVASKHSRASREMATFSAADVATEGEESTSAEARAQSPDPSPDSLAHAKELESKMSENLSEKESLVLRALLEMGFDPKALAREFDCSESAARGLVFRLRQRLSRWLQ